MKSDSVSIIELVVLNCDNVFFTNQQVISAYYRIQLYSVINIYSLSLILSYHFPIKIDFSDCLYRKINVKFLFLNYIY